MLRSTIHEPGLSDRMVKAHSWPPIVVIREHSHISLLFAFFRIMHWLRTLDDGHGTPRSSPSSRRSLAARSKTALPREIHRAEASRHVTYPHGTRVKYCVSKQVWVSTFLFHINMYYAATVTFVVHASGNKSSLLDKTCRELNTEIHVQRLSRIYRIRTYLGRYDAYTLL